MGYGASACHTTILNQELLKPFFQTLNLELPFENLEELYTPFEEYLTNSDFIDCFQSNDFREAISNYINVEDEEGSITSVPQELEEAIARIENFLSLLQKAEELTHLTFWLIWVGTEGDRYDDLSDEFAIELGNVYQLTEPGEKYAEYIRNVSWVEYG